MMRWGTRFLVSLAAFFSWSSSLWSSSNFVILCLVAEKRFSGNLSVSVMKVSHKKGGMMMNGRLLNFVALLDGASANIRSSVVFTANSRVSVGTFNEVSQNRVSALKITGIAESSKLSRATIIDWGLGCCYLG